MPDRAKQKHPIALAFQHADAKPISSSTKIAAAIGACAWRQKNSMNERYVTGMRGRGREKMRGWIVAARARGTS
jgi:hypothetical protein